MGYTQVLVEGKLHLLGVDYHYRNVIQKTLYIYIYINSWGHRGRHRMVVGYITTYAISVYHH